MRSTPRPKRKVKVKPKTEFGIATCVAVTLFFLSRTPAVGTDWQAEWEKTVKAAEQEGEVRVYVARYQAVVEAFHKTYPKVKLVVITAPHGALIISRLMGERRAGRYLADVYISGNATQMGVLYPAKVMEPIKPALILPEVLDESKWFQGKHHYVDPDNRYFLAFEGSASHPISYNKRLVKPEEIRSYWDLIDPRWRGKLMSHDPFLPSYAQSLLWFFYGNPQIGPEFLSRYYGEMDLTVSQDQFRLKDWLAAGKASLCFPCSETATEKEQGLPIDTIYHPMKEGEFVQLGFSVLTLLNRAPHPNAAKLFFNWLLSREGQITFQKMRKQDGGSNSLREDIPKDDVPFYKRRHKGVRYFVDDGTGPEKVTKALALIKNVRGGR